MRDGDLVAIDRIGDAWCGHRGEVSYKLVPEQIEVHPMFCRTAFRATEELAVERTGCRQIMDRHSQVEACKIGQCWPRFGLGRKGVGALRSCSDPVLVVVAPDAHSPDDIPTAGFVERCTRPQLSTLGGSNVSN